MPLDSTAGVWRWRETAVSGSRPHSQAPLRRQAIIQALVTAAIGVVVHRFFGHQTFAIVLWSIAGLVLMLGLFWPRGFVPLQKFGALLGRLVGGLLLYVLLVPLYYLLFFPVSLWLRARGRDPLHRKLRDRRYTCWIERGEKAPETDYKRQFLIEDRQAREALRPVKVSATGNSAPGRDESEDV